jgi:hypothetical protein
MLQFLYSQRKSPKYPLFERQVGPQSRTECNGERFLGCARNQESELFMVLYKNHVMSQIQ